MVGIFDVFGVVVALKPFLAHKKILIRDIDSAAIEFVAFKFLVCVSLLIYSLVCSCFLWCSLLNNSIH